jgi:transcription termination factor Rho
VSKAELKSKHLAELHALAADAGVPRYRMLRRDELVDELAAREGRPADRESAAENVRERPRRRRGRRGGRRRRRAPDDGGETEAAELGEASQETEEVTGVLEIVRAGHGFLRLKGPEPDPDDVYISASQIRRCELEDGDEVEGPARPPRRGERHRALVRVELVNGEEPPGEPEDGPDDEEPDDEGPDED